MLLLGILIALLSLALWKALQKPPKFPLGPSIFELGHIFKFFTKKLFLRQVLHNWGKKYGPVYGMKFGSLKLVFLDDYNSIREVLMSTDFLKRPNHPVIREMCGGEYGYLEDYPGYSRSIVLQALSEGFKSGKIEASILDETSSLLATFKEGESLAGDQIFTPLTIGIIWAIVTGKNNGSTYKELIDFNNDLSGSLAAVLTSFTCIVSFPIANIFPKWSGIEKLRHSIDSSQKFLSRVIREHKPSLTDESPQNIIDGFIEYGNRNDPELRVDKNEGEKHLIAIIMALFPQAGKSITLILMWSLLYLCKFPDAQKRFQDEIDSKIGKSRLPALKDKAAMPYYQALICEILRKSSPLQQTAIRIAGEDRTFRGFNIPKGAKLITNISQMHEDPEVWGDPENFRPTRFLKEDGGFRRQKELMLFGAGKISCPMEQVVKSSLFLVLTAIFQKYSVELDPTFKSASVLKTTKSDALFPEKFNIILTKR